MLLIPDCSEFQPHADMAGIKRVNGGAAIIRAAYGQAHPDHVFAKLRHDARTAGFAFLGLYQYLVAGQGVITQAQAFCDIVGTLGPHEVPILDLEEGTGDQAPRAAEWLAFTESHLGKTPWLYSGLNFARAHGLEPIFDGPEIHAWVAAYGTVEPSLGHTLWQCTNGKAGIHITAWPGAGRCDTSVYHGTLAQLAALIAPKPEPREVTHETMGMLSLAALADRHRTTPMHILNLTAQHYGGFGPGLSAWANGIFRGDIDPTGPVPEGFRLRVPVIP